MDAESYLHLGNFETRSKLDRTMSLGCYGALRWSLVFMVYLHIYGRIQWLPAEDYIVVLNHSLSVVLMLFLLISMCLDQCVCVRVHAQVCTNTLSPDTPVCLWCLVLFCLCAHACSYTPPPTFTSLSGLTLFSFFFQIKSLTHAVFVLC